MLAAALVLPSTAAASDTFVLTNSSKVATLTGATTWGGRNLFSGCVSGAFPGSNRTSYKFNPGATGSVTLTQNPFSSCPSGIPIQYRNGFIDPYLTGGSWLWAPHDPFIGYATLTCGVSGLYGSRLLTTRVDGLTCTVLDVSNNSAGSFASSAAPVRSGKAVVLVQHVPGRASGTRSRRARYEITLRDVRGHLLGRRRVTLLFGAPRKVGVPISATLRRYVSRHGITKVQATIRRVDGKPGTGHHTTLSVMRDEPGLP